MISTFSLSGCAFKMGFFFSHQDCEHSVVQLTRPVKLRRTPFRSRQSLRASIIYKGPAQLLTQPSLETETSTSTATKSENGAADLSGAPTSTDEAETQGNTRSDSSERDTGNQPGSEPTRCRALYRFTSEEEDQLSFEEGEWPLEHAPPRAAGGLKRRPSATGNLLELHTKGEDGWWYGGLDGKTGLFPSTYVEELPPSNQVRPPES